VIPVWNELFKLPPDLKSTFTIDDIKEEMKNQRGYVGSYIGDYLKGYLGSGTY